MIELVVPDNAVRIVTPAAGFFIFDPRWPRVMCCFIFQTPSLAAELPAIKQ
jgi:hypothetical protein